MGLPSGVSGEAVDEHDVLVATPTPHAAYPAIEPLLAIELPYPARSHDHTVDDVALLSDWRHVEGVDASLPSGRHWMPVLEHGAILSLVSDSPANYSAQMDLKKLRLFQRQVSDQSQAVIFAADQIDQALTSLRQLHVAGQHEGRMQEQARLFAGCQSLLASAANISKFLWAPPGKKDDDPKMIADRAEERHVLRNSLGVTDESPLKSRRMRNHLEHLDERIDTWWATSTDHNFLDHLVGSPDEVSGFADGDMFRVYDPAHHQIVFWGTRYDIIPLVEEAKRLFPLAAVEADKPHYATE